MKRASPGGAPTESPEKFRARRAFAEAVERMHHREANAQIAAAWYEDHEAPAEPEVFCPVTLKWIPRREWEAECRREAQATNANRRPPRPLQEIVLDVLLWSSPPVRTQQG
ncbi:MAG: hypothetical protein JWM32_1205 [Verrucomicrobia bacterium]|nr:hypothetical protein [Verrucomicrobiota bacterium]